MFRREDHSAQVFKIVKQMTTTDQYIVSDKCVRNSRGDLVTRDQVKHLAWKESPQRLLNEGFE